MSDLDRAIGGIDPQVGRHADGVAGGAVDDGVEQRIVACQHLAEPLPVAIGVGESFHAQIRPAPVVAGRSVGGVQLRDVPVQVQRLDAAVAPLHWRPRWAWARRPRLHGIADRLSVSVVPHIVVTDRTRGNG